MRVYLSGYLSVFIGCIIHICQSFKFSFLFFFVVVIAPST